MVSSKWRVAFAVLACLVAVPSLGARTECYRRHRQRYVRGGAARRHR